MAETERKGGPALWKRHRRKTDPAPALGTKNTAIERKKSHCNTTITGEFAQICGQAWLARSCSDCKFLNQCVLLQAKTGNWFALNYRAFCQKYRCGELPFSDAGGT